MAASFTIHIDNGLDEDALRCFFSSHIGGSIYAPSFEDILAHREYKCTKVLPGRGDGPDSAWDFDRCGHRDAVSHTPSFTVGEVSWLKAGLMDDSERYIPGPIEQLGELADEHPVIDAELIARVKSAFDAPNTSIYGMGNTMNELVEFLMRYMGYRMFSISW